jgi:hypothetical protein
MKKILILAQFFFVLTVCGQKSFELNYRYSIDFGYSHELLNYLVAEDSIIEKPRENQVEDLSKFIYSVNEKVKKAEVPVFFDQEFTMKLDSIELYGYQKPCMDCDYSIGSSVYDYRKVDYLRLLQEWYYNAKTNDIEVVVNGSCSVFQVYRDKRYKGNRPMYWNKQIVPTSYKNPRVQLSDSSVLWAHLVNFQLPVYPKEYSPTSFNNVRYEPSLKKMYDLELPALLFTQAINNQIEFYSPQTGKKMSVNELNDKLVLRDTVYMPDINGEMQIRPIKIEMGVYDLSSMLVNQTFIFDPKTLIITSRINSVIVTCKPDEDSAPIELFEVRFAN